MKYLDFAVQTLIILFAIGSYFLMLNVPYKGNPILMALLMAGLWQTGSSFLTVITESRYQVARRVHLGMTIVFMATHFLLHVNGHPVELNLIAIPVLILALCYYVITCRWVFYQRRRRNGSFLPNLSF